MDVDRPSYPPVVVTAAVDNARGKLRVERSAHVANPVLMGNSTDKMQPPRRRGRREMRREIHFVLHSRRLPRRLGDSAVAFHGTELET